MKRIGTAYAGKLAQANVHTLQALLKIGGTKSGRAYLASVTGIEEGHILQWANMADLLRIKGVGEDYALLLEAAGAGTVKDLRTRKPETLHTKLVEVNAAMKLVKQLPTTKKVEAWITRARSINPAVCP